MYPAATIHRTLGIVCVVCQITSCGGSGYARTEALLSPDALFRAERFTGYQSDGDYGDRIDLVSESELLPVRTTVARLQFPNASYERLFMRWRAPRVLEIGAPLMGSVTIAQPASGAVLVLLVPYPFAPSVRRYIDSEGRSLSKLTASDLANARVAPDLMDALAAATQIRGAPTAKYSYRSDFRRERTICRIDTIFSAAPLPGNALIAFSATIVSHSASYTLNFSGEGVSRSALVLTSAQIDGSSFRSSPLDLISDGQGGFQLVFGGESDFMAAISNIENPPFAVRFLWDFPDSAAEYVLRSAPDIDQLKSFLDCIHSARQPPGSDAVTS
jgi:hypothetical protein